MAATFFQGVTLGAYLNGITVADGRYAGAAFDWLTPFSVFTGLGLIAAYALLGATWLIMKTEGPLHERMRQLTRSLTWVLLGVIVIISLWTPFAHPEIAARWFSFPNLVWFAPVPLLVVLTVYGLQRSVRGESHLSPFILALILVFLGYSGLGISLWPYIIPPDITIWDAAGPPQSLGFTLVGALLVIPVILMYTSFAYWVFRGKVRHGEGYH